MHKMMKAILKKRGKMATDNGNGNGRGGGTGGAGGGTGGAGGTSYYNTGGANGTGKTAAQWAPTAVLLLALFGFWWASADPRSRLDKIEATQSENRKELNETITGLRKEFSTNYLSLREHIDLQARIKSELEQLSKKDDEKLTKVQFEAWKVERDKLIEAIQKSIGVLDNDVRELKGGLVTRNESTGRWAQFDRQDAEMQRRLEVLSAQLEKMKDLAVTNPLVESQTHRIDQLYALVREIQNHIFELNARIHIPPGPSK
jgi:hypothetical protein